MRQALKLHPISQCTAVTQIHVDVTRPRPGALVLHYVVTGRMRELRMPPATAPARAGELWRHTCFEAFVRRSPGSAYYEFNFAPSTQWAAYLFDDYRLGMSATGETSAIRIETRSNAEEFRLQASLEVARLQGFPEEGRLGLSAVIEETSGRKSYWALAHPPGKANFHHSACFAVELPRA
jgi:hypothetical protein